jgi:hypothetical protein
MISQDLRTINGIRNNAKLVWFQTINKKMCVIPFICMILFFDCYPRF